jgi:hypothetical protein
MVITGGLKVRGLRRFENVIFSSWGIKKAMPTRRHSEHTVFNSEFTIVRKFCTFISPHEKTSTERLPAGQGATFMQVQHRDGYCF